MRSSCAHVLLPKTVTKITGGGAILPLIRRVVWRVTPVLLLLLIPTVVLAQTLIPVDLPEDAVVEAPLYEDLHGDRYSTLVVVKFGEHVFDLPKGQVAVSLTAVRTEYAAVTDLFDQLETSYGSFTLTKRIPNAVWGDTLRVNKRTGATVTISDYSQIIGVWFDAPVPLADVVAELEAIGEVAYAEEPQVYYLLDEPNDPDYVIGNQYSLLKIDAARAWEINRGIGSLSPVGIAFADYFPCELAGSDMHPDLINKLTVVTCGNITNQHGYFVAGMAGAETDNGQSVASLGWNVELYGFHGLSIGLGNIVTALGDPANPAYGNVDVVQNSWVGGGVRNAVRDLLTMGIVVTGSAGNGQGCTPDGSGTCTTQQYPAAYYFDDIDAGDGTTYEAQVIAVSATGATDEFVDVWTWSPGTDPLAAPEQAFIDVAAPGEAVRIVYTDGVGEGGSYDHRLGGCWGTSCAGPIVAAQAALVLAINPSLRVDEVYEVITRSAEKVDQNDHPDSFTYTDSDTGETLEWNQYTGYGRINAYEALTYTIERFGATIPSGQTAALSNDSLQMWAGSELVADGNLDVQDVAFTARSSSIAWAGITLHGEGSFFDGVAISGASTGLDVRALSTNIYDTELVDNKVGLATDYASCGSPFCLPPRSEVYLDHVLIEGSLTYGLYLRNTDFGLSESTVRNGGEHGVYVKNATATSFHDNVIEGNGTGGASYDGLRVEANGEVDFSRRGNVFGYEGRNRIADNADKQVVYLNGGYLFMGSTTLDGDRNAVLDTGSGCRIYNSSGSILEAENDYWGTTSAPPASYFCGTYSVDVSPYLTSDPTGGSGGGYRPALGDPHVLASSGAGSTDSHPRGGDEDPVVWLRERIRAVRGQLAADPEAVDAPALVRLLAGLQRRDPTDATGEQAATEQVFRMLRNRLTQGNPDHLPPRLRRVVEGAAIVLTEAALAAGEVERADQLLAEYGSLVAGEEETLTLSLDAVAVDEALGRYNAALARIDGLIGTLGDTHDGLSEDLAFMAEVIAAKAGGGGTGRGTGQGEEATATVAVSKSGDAALPAEVALLAAYPNPTARAATVPFTLPEVAAVRVVVYDLLGREVAVLADGVLDAGRHALRLDGSRLAVGTYFVVATVGAAGRKAPRMLRQKVTVLR